MEDKPDIKKISLGIVIGTIIIGGVIYGSYIYFQKAKRLIPQNTNTGQTETPPTAPLRFTAAPDVDWISYTGKIYPYSFSYPQTLDLSIFPNDKYDSVAINWGNIPPENNLLLNIEFIDDRDAQYIGNIQEYAKNWWKFFSGLKGIASIDKFTNASGLIGYKAVYINSIGQSPNIDVFFEVAGNASLAIHLANGVLDADIFNRIINSVKWEAPQKTAE